MWGWAVGMGGDRRHSGGFLLRIMPPPWHSVPTLRNNNLPQAGRSTCRHDGAAGGSVLLCDEENWNRTQQRGGNDCCRWAFLLAGTRALQAEQFYFAAKKIRIGRGNVAATTSQAGHSFLRHDGAAAILDFKPRIGNHCSTTYHFEDFRAAILDFKPRLANRCSQKAKTGAIPPAQGRTALCRGRGMPDGQGLRTA